MRLTTSTKLATSAAAICTVASCASAPPPDTRMDLVAFGEAVFFGETFDGNGRTCGTCHRREDNFGLSPAFIATLPKDDPLFVAERQRALRENFEKPDQMRERGLILENQDGFDDLATNFNLRGVPHVLALATSVASSDGPHVGWSGDGAPGDRSLRSFAVGAIIQHFTRRLDRVAGRDFRMPTDRELDAIEAFMLTLGRQQDLELPIQLRHPTARAGQRAFLDNSRGKCNVCHLNAGANVDPRFFDGGTGNLNFATGVPDLPGSPPDDGFDVPGRGEFNTPPLVEAADTAPFFHNNSAPTLEAAVAFYNTPAFNDSPAGRALDARTGGPIAIGGDEIVSISTFLRVLNALENIRVSVLSLQEARAMANQRMDGWKRPLTQAGFETDDAIEVLEAAGVHEAAVVSLRRAREMIDGAGNSRRREASVRQIVNAIAEHGQARAELEGGGGA